MTIKLIRKCDGSNGYIVAEDKPRKTFWLLRVLLVLLLIQDWKPNYTGDE